MFQLPASNKINGAQYLLSAYPFSRRYCCALIRACRSDNPEMMFSEFSHEKHGGLVVNS